MATIKSNSELISYELLLKTKGNDTIVDDNRVLTEKMKSLPSKHKISAAYMNCLLNWLIVCLDKMQKKNLQDRVHSLMGMLLTVSVYRIPEFKKVVMQLLEDKCSSPNINNENSAKIQEIGL